GLVFAVERGLDRFGFAGVPLAPASRLDVGAHGGVQENDAGVRPPGPAQPDVLDTRFGGQAAALGDVRAFLVGGGLALGGDEADLVGRAVDLAVLEESVGVAEDEVDMAFDIALREVLPAGSAGAALVPGI